MFTHDQIWMAIDRLAESRGFSPSGLARQSGLDPTAFNRSKRISPNGKPRWPSTESISKILAVTSSTMTDLFSLMDGGSDGGLQIVPLLTHADLRAGRIASDKAGVFSISLDAGDSAFAVRIDDDHFHPLFRAGSVIIADRDLKMKANDRILLFSSKDGLKGGILQSAQKRNLTVLLPGDSFREVVFAESDVEWTARILWASH